VPGALMMVHAKADLGAKPVDSGPFSTAALVVSAVTGEGMDSLVAALIAAGERLLPPPGDYALSARQRTVMERARDALAESAKQTDDVLIAESLRSALASLDEITGRATTEAVLDELFSGFCIGK